jgi:NADH-quinone oxidoreductase subunit N
VFSDTTTVWVLWPEIALAALAVWIYVGNALFRPKPNTQTRLGWTTFAAAAVAFAGFALYWHQGGAVWRQSLVLEGHGPLAIDYFAYAMRTVALLAGFLLVLQASRAGENELVSEYLGTLLLAIVGVMLTASANELIFLFLGLEMLSIPTYVLLFLGRRDGATAEATIKYFFLSVASSAMLLYGFGFLYGMAGSTSLTEIRAALETNSAADGGLMTMAPLALILVFAGLGFRIAAAPFHFYAPDVYQGATHANASLLSILPKIAGIVVFVRLVGVTMPALGDFAWQLAIVLSILTMTIGNVSALWQTNLRRLMAYSSIAHSGYMLIGLAVALAASPAEAATGGLSSVILYLFVYVFATLGAFAAFTYLGAKDREVNRIDELAGVAKTRPVAAAIIAVCMFSLSGVPPLAGFWGKLALFGNAIRLATNTESASLQWWFIVLAVVGVLNAAVAAAYYLRIVGVMYFRTADTALPAQGGWGAWSAAAAAAAMVLAVGVLPGRLFDNAQRAELAVKGIASPESLSQADAPTSLAK